MKIHTFTSEVEAYNASQCDESIADGDLLIIGHPPEATAIVAVLVKAWPTVVLGPPGPGELHRLAEGVSWDSFAGGRYAPSVVRAHQYVQERWEAGMLEREKHESA
jgi:hypothetical protein